MDTLCACIYIMGFTLSLADAIKTRKKCMKTEIYLTLEEH